MDEVSCLSTELAKIQFEFLNFDTVIAGSTAHLVNTIGQKKSHAVLIVILQGFRRQPPPNTKPRFLSVTCEKRANHSLERGGRRRLS